MPPIRSDGSVVYLHGVGDVRDRWEAPVARALAGLRVQLTAPEYSDLLSSSPAEVPAIVPIADIGAIESRRWASDHDRRAYVDRQRRVADLVHRVGESTRATWPTALPHPADVSDHLPLHAVLRTPVLGLDQVGRYLDDADRRAAVLQRVVSALADTPRPRVVIAHSLGSLIAWDALEDPRTEIDLLVTLGSPLARAALAPGRMDFPYDRVGAWLNMVHLLDPVPAGRGLGATFPAAVDAYLAPWSDNGEHASPIDRVVSAVTRLAISHLESTYLESRTVAAVMRDALLAPPVQQATGLVKVAS